MERPAVVAARLSKAVSRTLRVSEGSAAFTDYLAILQSVRSGEMSARDAHAAIRGVRVEGDKLRPVTAQAVRRCIAGPPEDVDCARELAQSVVAEIVEVNLLGKAVPRLIEDGVTDASSAERYVDACRSALLPDLQNLAGQLAQHPQSNEFRALPHRRDRRSTIDQLNEEIL
jgi:hypothetical protein